MTNATLTTDPPATTPSLYERIGGRPAVIAAVDGLYVRLLDDPATARFFVGMDMSQLNAHMRLFLASALSGTANRSGRDLGEAHARLGITDADFDRVATHLTVVLQTLGVEPGLLGEVIGVVASLRPVIVSRVVDAPLPAAAS